MIRKLLFLIVLLGAGSVAQAADNFVVKDATAATITKRSKDTGSGVQADANVLLNSSFTVVDPATSTLQTAGNASLATIATNSAAATPAGEAHVGEVGGNQATIAVAQAVTASSAYAAGNAVGGLITFASAARVSAGSGLVQSIVASAKSAQTGALELWLFSASPSASTCTDKTAFALAAADFDKVFWVSSIGSWYSGGTPSIGLSTDRAIPFAVASGTSLYGCLVTRATPTYASTSDISVAIRVIRN